MNQNEYWNEMTEEFVNEWMNDLNLKQVKNSENLFWTSANQGWNNQ